MLERSAQPFAGVPIALVSPAATVEPTWPLPPVATRYVMPDEAAMSTTAAAAICQVRRTGVAAA